MHAFVCLFVALDSKSLESYETLCERQDDIYAVIQQYLHIHHSTQTSFVQKIMSE